MELKALDSHYNVVAILYTNNVQWNRKYYAPGNFTVQIREKDFDPSMKYVYMTGRDDLGVIQKLENQVQAGKRYVLLSGLFSECELDDDIVDGTFYANGNIETELKRMISTYLEEPSIIVDPSRNLGGKIEFQETGGELAKVSYERLKTQELSLRLKFDLATTKKHVEIWQGKDRTQSQSTENFVVFNSELIQDEKVIEDSSGEKNWAKIGGSGEGDKRIYTYLDLSDGQKKKKIFINGSSLSYDPEKQTLEQYKAELRQYGLEQMLKHKKIQDIQFNVVNTGSIEYLKDFDLGDKCDIVIEPLHIRLESRIIEIYEVFKDNLHQIRCEFGNKKLRRF